MSPCQGYRDKIHDLIDDDLDGMETRHVRDHLRDCPDCASYFNQLARLRSILKGFGQTSTSPNFQVVLRERLRREMAGKKDPWVVYVGHPRRWVAVAGVAVVLVTSAFLVLNNRQVLMPGAAERSAGMHAPAFQSAAADEHIEYVSSESRGRIRVARSENKAAARPAKDTLAVQASPEEPQYTITPVSF